MRIVHSWESSAHLVVVVVPAEEGVLAEDHAGQLHIHGWIESQDDHQGQGTIWRPPFHTGKPKFIGQARLLAAHHAAQTPQVQRVVVVHQVHQQLGALGG
jgi:hypothetical protein